MEQTKIEREKQAIERSYAKVVDGHRRRWQ